MDFNTFLLWVFAGMVIVGIVAIIILAIRLKNGSVQQGDTGYFSSFKILQGNSQLLTIKGKLNIMALSLINTQQASGVLTFRDKKLEITDVPDGAVTLTSSNEEVFTASYEDSTNTVTVVAGKSGVAALSIKATNAGGKDIPFEDIAVEVKSGDPETGSIEFGPATEQP